jgi:YD repeat-containing protein
MVCAQRDEARPARNGTQDTDMFAKSSLGKTAAQASACVRKQTRSSDASEVRSHRLHQELEHRPTLLGAVAYHCPDTFAPALAVVVSSYFDALGNLTSRRLSGNTQARFDMSYDANSNLLSVSRYADAAGTQLNGTSSFTYDSENNLKTLTHKNASNTVLASYSYSYDAGARLTSETDNGTTTNYTYDSTNQILTAGTSNYAWDANGNTKATNVVIGQNNQLLSDGTWNYSYDKEGNLIRKAGISNGLTWTFGYDNANQMTSAVETNSSNQTLVSATYTYDVFGNRIASSVTVSGTTTVTHYAYNNGQLWADLSSSNALQTRYLSGQGADQWFARMDSTGTNWLLTDHLGSIRDVMNSSGTVIDHINYDAFGLNTSESNSSNGRGGTL